MATILWILGILGILLIIGGAVRLWARDQVWGIVLIVVGMALGGFGIFG